ncbi:hypothetical protein CFP56_025534 [Quercus suber]|uniref:Uncharacterized protein n=1 Tax=Quercus suber TaxID=58331 RepID=A0AAW0K473_QUESU
MMNSRSHTLAPAPAPATGGRSSTNSTDSSYQPQQRSDMIFSKYNGEAGSDGFQVLTPYGQMLTLVEYMLLLYRALLPTPVQSFFAALKVLSQKEVHYGSYATSEKVNAPETSICQEKMLAPVQLCCKHIFCEDCFRMCPNSESILAIDR